MTSKLDKCKGLFYVAALGDCLGSPHEFIRVNAKCDGQIQFQNKSINRYKKADDPERVKFFQLGQLTDDTEMAICILNCLAKRKGQYHKEIVLKNYLDWANIKTSVCLGKNTRALMKGVTTLQGYEKRFEKLENKEGKQSNGSLMRCGVLALAKVEDSELLKIIKKDCYLTNPNEVAYECSRILVMACRDALSAKYTKEQIVDRAYQSTTVDIVKKYIKHAIDQDDLGSVVTAKKTKGWCIISLYVALMSFLHFEGVTEPLVKIINMGGDTDTNACIAGYLIGAYYGFEKAYQENTLNYNLLYKCDTEGGDYPRPEYLRFKHGFKQVLLLE